MPLELHVVIDMHTHLFPLGIGISGDMGSDQCNQLNFNTIFVLKGYS